jgi:Ca2+-binding RTX toxin-like protein
VTLALTGLGDATFEENTVNATPQLIDANVAFTATSASFNGGTLTVSGLLAEDRVSIANGATISLSGGVVYYDADGAGGAAAVAIGTATGGVGATFTVTFNAAATATAIDALIESLTYANVSDAPTTSRGLVLNITDGVGGSLGAVGGVVLSERTGAANPFDGISVGSNSAATFADLDNDGDLDALVGEEGGQLRYLENTGTSSAAVFTARTGAANPFNGVDVGYRSAPTLVDLDGDGDLDAVVGSSGGHLRYFENTGTVGAPVFTQRSGSDNPFNGVNVGYASMPAFADLDGDGDLDAVIGESYGVLHYLENTGTVGAPVFIQLVGSANPFDGIDIGDGSVPTFADLDGDGDLDALVGEFFGELRYFENTGTVAAPAFTQRTGGANPFSGVYVRYESVPTVADLDGDGDLDAVVGDRYGTLHFLENTTVRGASITLSVTAQSDAPSASGLPTDVTLTGDVVGDLDLSAVTLGDGDGDNLTVVLTASAGTMTAASGGGVTVTNSGTGAIILTGAASAIDTFLNTASAIQYTGASNASGDNVATVTVTADDGSGAVTLGVVNVDITNDAPSATGLPTDVTVTEDAAANLDLSAVTISDPDTTGSITVVLTASAGTMTATSGGGVTVTDSGTGAITLTGAASAIDDFLNTASAILYTGPANVSGNNTATVTITANDGFGAVTLGTVNIDITNVDDPMSLTGVATSATFGENTVNAAPQLLDIDVAFVHADNDYGGGTLEVSGLLAEDRISIASGDTISLSAGTVYYDADGAGGAAAIAIGTASGGSGATFTVTFNGSATSAAIDALIQNLTYANVSDTPTASRTLTINVTDATGDSLNSAPSYTGRTGPANPFNGFSLSSYSAPAFADLDGDGDLDAVSGEHYGRLYYFQNTGSASSPGFSGAANSINTVDIGYRSTAAFADLDGDGDLDALVGEYYGQLRYFENTGTAAAAVFTARTGTANPFDGVDVGYRSRAAFADLDGDGDLDAVIGDGYGRLNYFENTGTASAPVFIDRSGAANPFDGVRAGWGSAPAFADVDGDGDLDALVGAFHGQLLYFENTGAAVAPVFIGRSGAANPFNGISVGNDSSPAFADLDGDGDPDLLIGEKYGSLHYYQNTMLRAPSITITVTAETDGPTAGADTFTGTAGDDVLEGLGGDDILGGGDGNDLLLGGAGADTMTGGLGDDIYSVNEAGDVVDETGGDGTDTVRSSISYTLTAGVENLTLLFNSSINGTGNALDNLILGNGGANVLAGLAGDDTINGGSGADTLSGGDDDDSLDGGAGNDSLEGGDGTDTLIGGAGNDRLDGGTGGDAMTGGAGGDTYVVDDAGDTVTELANGGKDTVEASVSWILGDNVENLTLTGSAATGTGNALNNAITGNGGGNTLIGGAGNDILSGMGGSDTLIGGAGADSLTGGLGADTFLFTDADIGVKLVTDRVLDLNFADGDVIDLSGIDANSLLASDQAFSFVTKFTKTAGQAVLTYSAGKNVTTLSVDINGDGKADYAIAITGDHRGTTGNLYTGPGDTDGGWVL